MRPPGDPGGVATCRDEGSGDEGQHGAGIPRQPPLRAGPSAPPVRPGGSRPPARGEVAAPQPLQCAGCPGGHGCEPGQRPGQRPGQLGECRPRAARPGLARAGFLGPALAAGSGLGPPSPSSPLHSVLSSRSSAQPSRLCAPAQRGRGRSPQAAASSYRVMESSLVKETFQIIQSSHQPSSTVNHP